MTSAPGSDAQLIDARLVASVATGSENALGALYDRYADAIYGHARRLLGDPQAAEEIVQETFLALWNRAETYDERLGSVAGWLRSIGRHRVVDRLRSAGRGPRVVAFSDLGFDTGGEEADALDLAIAAGEPAGSGQADASPEASLLAGELRGRVRAAVATLPEEERVVIELAYSEGLSQSEVAVRLGWPLGTVKTRTRRALRGLRAVLGEDLPDGDGGEDGLDGPEDMAADPRRGGEFGGSR